MRLLLFAGFLTGAASLAAMPISAQQTTQRTMMSAPSLSGGSQLIQMNRQVVTNRGVGRGNRGWGNRVNGRWFVGYQAPGGWAGYRRPVGGFVLPGFWLQPGYHIGDYRAYGLPAPSEGYGWSRYYDDAVLTDRYGRVSDSRVDYAWDRYGGYDDDRDYREDRDGDAGRTVAGAVIGGVTGGLLGSAIAGPGHRTGGAILGAGVGAIAGGALANATSGDGTGYDDRTLGYDPYYARPGGYAETDDRADVRRFRADERKLVKAEAKLRNARAKDRAKLDRLARNAGYRDYADYQRSRAPRAAYAQVPRPMQPHWAMKGGADGSAHAISPRIEYQELPGHVAGGYYYPGPAITTITIPTTVVTTTTTETSYVTAKTVKPMKARTRTVRTKLLRR